jgi:hypothetical protein
MTNEDYNKWIDENNLTVQEAGYILGLKKTQSYNLVNETRVLSGRVERAIKLFNYLPTPKRKAYIKMIRSEIKKLKSDK